MKKTVWHKGPPPEIGWWPASYFRSIESIRWWDGVTWSQDAFPSDTAEEAAYVAKSDCGQQDAIEWTERWWV